MNQNEWTQLRELRELQERMNRFFEETRHREAARDDADWGQESDWTPPVDIFESDEGIVLKIDLPEVDQRDVNVRVDGSRLIISGERKVDPTVKRERYYRIERGYGRFARAFTLPEAVDRDRIVASYREGVLRLVLPRRTEEQQRTINIQVR